MIAQILLALLVGVAILAVYAKKHSQPNVSQAPLITEDPFKPTVLHPKDKILLEEPSVGVDPNMKPTCTVPASCYEISTIIYNPNGPQDILRIYIHNELGSFILPGGSPYKIIPYWSGWYRRTA